MFFDKYFNIDKSFLSLNWILLWIKFSLRIKTCVKCVIINNTPISRSPRASPEGLWAGSALCRDHLSDIRGGRSQQPPTCLHSHDWQHVVQWAGLWPCPSLPGALPEGWPIRTQHTVCRCFCLPLLYLTLFYYSSAPSPDGVPGLCCHGSIAPPFLPFGGRVGGATRIFRPIAVSVVIRQKCSAVIKKTDID